MSSKVQGYDMLSMRTESDSSTPTPSDDSSSTIEGSPILTPSDSGASDMYTPFTVRSDSLYDTSTLSSRPCLPSYHGTDSSSEFSAGSMPLLDSQVPPPEYRSMELIPEETCGPESFAEKGSPRPSEGRSRRPARCQSARRVFRMITRFALALCVLSVCFGFWKPNLWTEEPLRRPTASRSTYLNTGSQSLSGKYPLYDVLHITSTSGSIDIDVEPQEADAHNPKPAKLIVESTSGSIRVNMRGASFSGGIPDREYITSIHIPSGSVQGSLVHGKSTSVVTRSGSIHLDIMTYVPKAQAICNNSSDSGSKPARTAWSSSLLTHSESGSQSINLSSASSLSGCGGGGDPFSHLKSAHSARSGQLRLMYPSDWFGRIKGQSQSGSLSLSGPGVRIIGQNGGGAAGMKYVNAERVGEQDGNAILEFETSSGSADVVFR